VKQNESVMKAELKRCIIIERRKIAESEIHVERLARGCMPASCGSLSCLSNTAARPSVVSDPQRQYHCAGELS